MNRELRTLLVLCLVLILLALLTGCREERDPVTLSPEQAKGATQRAKATEAAAQAEQAAPGAETEVAAEAAMVPTGELVISAKRKVPCYPSLNWEKDWNLGEVRWLIPETVLEVLEERKLLVAGQGEIPVYRAQLFTGTPELGFECWLCQRHVTPVE